MWFHGRKPFWLFAVEILSIISFVKPPRSESYMSTPCFIDTSPPLRDIRFAFFCSPCRQTLYVRGVKCKFQFLPPCRLSKNWVVLESLDTEQRGMYLCLLWSCQEKTDVSNWWLFGMSLPSGFVNQSWKENGLIFCLLEKLTFFFKVAFFGRLNFSKSFTCTYSNEYREGSWKFSLPNSGRKISLFLFILYQSLSLDIKNLGFMFRSGF